MRVHVDLPGHVVGDGTKELFLCWWMIIEIEVAVLPLICCRDFSTSDEVRAVWYIVVKD